MKKWLMVVVLFYLPFAVRSQIITTIAGNGTGVDGSLAITAGVTDPSYLTFDIYGNLYFSEADAHKIRKINTAGIINTIAGTGAIGFSGDSGLATAAELHQPAGVAVDGVGNVYIADLGNNRIRKIDASTGIITTIAGNGTAGYGGDSGPATAAVLYQPAGLCIDRSGNLYIGDYGNHRIRKINTAGIITTVAGSGAVGWGGDGGPATDAMVSPSAGIFVDTSENLYIAEWTYGVMRKVDTSGIITLIAGDTSSHIYNGDGIPATSAHMDPDYVMIADSGEVYISDQYNNRIRKVDASGIIHTVAGTGVGGYSGDGGLADTAKLHTPSGLAFDHCGNLYFGQVNTPRIRKITFDTSGVPIISISPNVEGVICAGTTIIYSANVTTGSAITYQWYANNTFTGATSSTYTYTPANGDSIHCVLTGVSQCSGDTVTVNSNTIYMAVTPIVTPTISLTSNASLAIGSTVTVNATISSAGSSYSINWYDNGVLFNTTTVSMVTYTKGAGTDNITATVIPSSLLCYDSSTSGVIVITVTNLTTPYPLLKTGGGCAVFPNPAHDGITVEGQNIVNVSVSNVLGQVLIAQDCNASTININIAALPDGVYAVKVTDGEGNKTVKKIVKQ